LSEAHLPLARRPQDGGLFGGLAFGSMTIGLVFAPDPEKSSVWLVVTAEAESPYEPRCFRGFVGGRHVFGYSSLAESHKDGAMVLECGVFPSSLFLDQEGTALDVEVTLSLSRLGDEVHVPFFAFPDASSIWANAASADFSIFFGETEYRVHKDVLFARAGPRFCDCFSEDKPIVVDLDLGASCRPEDVDVFLHGVYSGVLALSNVAQAIALLDMCNFFHTPWLRSVCERYLAASLRLDNVMSLLCVACGTRADELRRVATVFAATHRMEMTYEHWSWFFGVFALEESSDAYRLSSSHNALRDILDVSQQLASIRHLKRKAADLDGQEAWVMDETMEFSWMKKRLCSPVEPFSYTCDYLFQLLSLGEFDIRSRAFFDIFLMLGRCQFSGPHAFRARMEFVFRALKERNPDFARELDADADAFRTKWEETDLQSHEAAAEKR
jgi:BTB/POZ domain